MVQVAKNSNRAVSEILGIKDKYIAYCIDEAALYVWTFIQKMPGDPTLNARALLNKYAKRKK